MKTVLLIAALALAVSALPSADEITPEDPLENAPDTSVPEPDNTLIQTLAHAEAHQMLEKNGKNACEDLADATEDEVKKNIKNAQELLDKINKGKNCKNKGQTEVADAKKLKMSTENKVNDAKAALDKANKAKIDFGKFQYDQLKEGNCGQFFNSKVYQDAKAKAKAATTAMDTANGELTAATKAVENAEISASAKANECACEVRGLHTSELAKSNDKVKAANTKAWTKAAHLKCVIAGTAASSCTVPPLPKVKAVSVADEVKNANCGPNDCSKSGNCLNLYNQNCMTKCTSGCGGGNDVWYKTCGNSWNGEVISKMTISKGQGIEFQWANINSNSQNGNMMFGLDDSNSNNGYQDIRYAIQMYVSGNGGPSQKASGNVLVYENGSHRTSKSINGGTRKEFSDNHVASIRWCKDGTVKYFLDRKLFYTSKTKISSTVMKPGSSFYQQYSGVRDAQRISFGDDCDTEFPSFK